MHLSRGVFGHQSCWILVELESQEVASHLMLVLGPLEEPYVFCTTKPLTMCIHVSWMFGCGFANVGVVPPETRREQWISWDWSYRQL